MCSNLDLHLQRELSIEKNGNFKKREGPLNFVGYFM